MISTQGYDCTQCTIHRVHTQIVIIFQGNRNQKLIILGVSHILFHLTNLTLYIGNPVASSGEVQNGRGGGTRDR